MSKNKAFFIMINILNISPLEMQINYSENCEDKGEMKEILIRIVW